MSTTPEPDSVSHLDSTIQTLADLHARHYDQAPEGQIGIERFIRAVGKPRVAFAVIAFVAAWIGVNLALLIGGGHPFDPPQFFWLQGLVSFCSLLMTTLILITQNRQSALNEKRAQATLQLAMVSEQKIAKVIELLQSLRTDLPMIANPQDPEAAAMADPIDVPAAVDRLEAAQDETIRRLDASP
ncbi:MAG: DUF1003 domain-containing protein [Candidatus Eremiobacteraeota bacterium]|nr:DUF1003 domain-containing protein [Candidatus Eremiobacteraeota bacterium]